MTQHHQLSQSAIERLAADVQAKILATSATIAHSDGRLVIKTYPRDGGNFEVKLTIPDL